MDLKSENARLRNENMELSRQLHEALRMELVSGEQERRQVFDLPPLQIEVTEHRAATVVCPGCGKRNVGAFPSTVSQSAQYGPQIKGLCVYLHQQHLLPMARLSEVVNELFNCSVSPGSIVNWLETASQTVTLWLLSLLGWRPILLHFAQLPFHPPQTRRESVARPVQPFRRPNPCTFHVRLNSYRGSTIINGQ